MQIKLEYKQRSSHQEPEPQTLQCIQVMTSLESLKHGDEQTYTVSCFSAKDDFNNKFSKCMITQLSILIQVNQHDASQYVADEA